MSAIAKLDARRRRRRGFSLVEALVSSFIFVTLMVAVYAALSDALDFHGIQGTFIKMQMDGRRALERMSGELRMTGRFDNPVAGEPGYPYVFTNGVASDIFAPLSHPAPVRHLPPGDPASGDVRSIVFKTPEDVDGDGLLTASATGDIEWTDDDISYVLVSDAAGTNILERRVNNVTTDVIARGIERITFDTIDTDPAVDFDEIVITIYMARQTPRGSWLQANLTTCVTMRNTEEVN